MGTCLAGSGRGRADARAAGGAAVVLERLADRGAGVLRAASRPASRLVQRPAPTDPTSPMRPLVVDHAVRPSRLRSSTASRTARRARRASPRSRCRCRSRPAIGVRFTGARASRCRADAKPGSQPGSQPAARSAASTAASRPMPDGHLEADDARPGARPQPGVTHAQVAAVESVLHCEEARPFPGRQLRHSDPVFAGEHAAMVRLHVAETGRPRRCRMPCRGPSSTVSHPR